MVQPERVPGEETRRARTPRAALIGATVVFVVAVAFGLGRLTAPAPEAAETSTTTTTEPSLSRPTTTTTFDLETFRVADIAAGGPIRWVRGTGLGRDVPVSVVDHADRLLMFAWPGPPTGGENPTGLRLWTTEEGIFWLEQGDVIGPDYAVTAVSSQGDRLVALGTETATGTAAILTSTDASTWTPHPLPLPRPLNPGERLEVRHALTSSGSTLVFGTVENAPLDQLYPYLPVAIANAAREHGLAWDGPPYRFWIHGPWGMTAYAATAEELGIPDEIIERLDFARGPETYVWRSTDAGNWEVGGFDAHWIESAIIDESGTVTVHGFGTSGPMSWTSDDGTNWEPANSSRELFSVVRGPAGFAGVDYATFQPEVVVSDDGLEWRGAGVTELLPSTLDWTYEWVAGAESGLAVLARGFLQDDDRSLSPPAASLQRNGYEMRLDLTTGVFEVNDAETGENLVRDSAWGKQPTPGVDVDLGARTVTIVDDTDQGPLVTFGFDEMLAAERASWGATLPQTRGYEAFLFSRDGTEWSIQDMADVMVGDVIVQMLVSEDRILAVSADRLSVGTTSPSFRTWLGMVPSG